MKTKLSKKWMPSENVLSLARSRGMPIEDWLYHLIPEFKLYWLERDILRCWDSTFWVHAKSQWEKVDKHGDKYNTQYNNFPDPNPPKTITTTANSKPIWVSITPEQSIENFNRQCERLLK